MPENPIDPTVLALMQPEFRRLAQDLAALPVSERWAALLAWCAARPDGEEILESILAADPDGPPPIGTDGA